MSEKKAKPKMLKWEISPDHISYPDALGKMEQEVFAVQNGQSDGLVWLLEHPPLYTAGTSSKSEDLLDHNGYPVYETGRGGQFTYHGPGQRVAYLMLDLNKYNRDLKAYICNLERWIILTLKDFGIEGLQRKDRVGIWVIDKTGQEKKIAAIGVRVKKWVTMHGIAINVNPDLSHFSGIVPCGLKQFGVTSFHDLNINISMNDLDKALQKNFGLFFN
ncbi:MAG: lipoyl(octanoyl) transferase LipB [Alphaproteobacteria bacterium]|jgi:lipoyl(octanoyl) transferase|nr:lipoyl(octanoyl) transferase LipB [Alphaproteobacteria bacterium]MBP9877392.1 lipoyl(octanoyl) transferase LipB [Alphaproteobacteria bacterium]